MSESLLTRVDQCERELTNSVSERVDQCERELTN